MAEAGAGGKDFPKRCDNPRRGLGYAAVNKAGQTMIETADKALRARLLWFAGNPEDTGESAIRYIEDGLLVLAKGRVVKAGEASALLASLPAAARVVDHRPHLLVPGFIDPHIHFPQTQVIASYGAQLLDWLNTYTFVEEQKFADPAHAARSAAYFFDELLSAGTTTAVTFCSVHKQSAEAFFTESAKRNTRMLGGKVMMDRNAPPALTDTAQSGYDDSRALIETWHHNGRQLYAIAPRFAITSTPAQLEAAGTLSREHPDCLVQTHISENLNEIDFTLSLYPDCPDYTGVYEKYGLFGRTTLLGHCIHLSESEKQRFAEAGAVAVFCPTSNLFLGSGLFNWQSMRDARRPVRIACATDVGGGTSYSMMRTMSEAYKVLQLQGQKLTGAAALHAITRGNAHAIGLGDTIGSFEPGFEADAVVLDSRATPLMAHRMETARNLAEELFILTTLSDERSVVETYVMGEASKPKHR